MESMEGMEGVEGSESLSGLLRDQRLDPPHTLHSIPSASTIMSHPNLPHRDPTSRGRIVSPRLLGILPTVGKTSRWRRLRYPPLLAIHAYHSFGGYCRITKIPFRNVNRCSGQFAIAASNRSAAGSRKGAGRCSSLASLILRFPRRA
jgi:hypothetical protein